MAARASPEDLEPRGLCNEFLLWSSVCFAVKKNKTKQKPPVHLCVDVCMRAHLFALVTGLALFAGSSRGSPANWQCFMDVADWEAH